MPEQRHQRLQTHAGVGQLSRPGVAQLMRCDDEHAATGRAQPGSFGGGEQPVAQPGVAEAAPVLGEQEVGELPGAWMRQWSVRPTLGDPFVEGGDGGRRQRHHAFGGELAQRHLQPGAGGPVVDDAAEFQVKQLTDSQPGAA